MNAYRTACFLFFTLLLGMSPSISRAQPLETVSIQLKWQHSFQFAGYYAAIEKGFYREEGLDVRLVEHDINGKHYIQSVTDGDSEYGTADMGLLLSFAEGAPVVWLSQIFQHSPLVLLTLSQSSIFSPYELIGKKVAFDSNDAGNAPIQMLFDQTLGPNSNLVENVPLDYNLSRMIRGEIDASSAYLSDQPYALKQLGYDVNVINPRNFGIDFYGDNLFTSRSELINHPDRVKKMIRASLKGWNYALDHPEEIIDLILSKYNTQHHSRDHLRYEANVTDRMILRDQTPLGKLDPQRVEPIIAAYHKLRLLKTQDMPDGLFYEMSKARIELTRDEREWLLNHPKINLVMGEGLEPIVIKEPNGAIVGIIPDFLDYLGEIIGQKLTLITEPDLKRTHQRLQQDEIFGVAVTLDSPQRRKAFKFTDPYYQTQLIVFTNKNHADELHTRNDLNGKRVAVPEGHPSLSNYLAGLDDVTIVHAETPEAQLKLLQYGEVDAIVGYANYHYLIQAYLYTNLVPAFTTQHKFPIYIGIKPEHAPLVTILNKAIATLGERKRFEIISSWLNMEKPRLPSGHSINLTNSERQYLNALKKIRVAVQTDRLPYEGIDRQGNYQGIVADYIDLFAKRLQIAVEVVPTENYQQSLLALSQGRCDIIAAQPISSQVTRQFLTTTPYLISPRVFAVHRSLPVVSDFNEIAQGKIGIVADSADQHLLAEIYPQLALVPVTNTDQGLQQVASNKLDAFVDVLGSISYSIQKQALSSVKIGGAIPRDEQQTIVVSDKVAALVPILNKVISHTSAQDRKEIMTRWISVTYDNGINHKMLFKLAGVMLLLLGFMFYRQNLIRRNNTALMIAHKELEEKNRELNLLSMTDKLTGLLNRHAIDPIIKKEISRNKRSNNPVSLLIIDLDHFKLINDTYGHAAGDKVLTTIAQALSDMIRGTDSLARWGGEEFLLVATDTRILKATALAEKVRQTIENLNIDAMTITASIGVAEFHPDETFHQWYERCDKALYLAKDSGRNRVKVAQLPQSENVSPLSISNLLQLTWSNKFCSGHDEIDEQHMQLFSLANDLIDAFLMRRDATLIDEKLLQLSQKNSQHFRQEEQLLRRIHYPDVSQHCAEHELMEKKLDELVASYQQNRSDYSDLIHFISMDLISAHLLSIDNHYYPYLIDPVSQGKQA